MSKLEKLEAKNIKGLREFALDFRHHGHLLVIGGRNGAGKSSALDTLQYLFGGATMIPKDVLRHGTKKGKIEGFLDDGTRIRRTITEKGVYLVVEDENGRGFASPQETLDKIIQAANGGSGLGFDPLAFASLSTKDQVELLKSVLGVDTSVLDSDFEQAYDNRREVARDLKKVEAVLASLPEVDPEIPDEEISLAALLEERKLREALNASNTEQRQKLEQMRKTLTDQTLSMRTAEARVADLEIQLEKAHEELIDLRQEADNLIFAGRAQREKVGKLRDEDLGEIEKQLSEVEATNAGVRAKKEAKRLHATATEYRKAIEEAVQTMAHITAEKQALVQNASPIPGLVLTDEGVEVDGVRCENLSAAELLRVSVGIAIALNPELKVVLIRDGSLLDDANLKAFEQMAIDSDAVFLVERVGSGPEVTILLEDGLQVEKEVKE